jgi:hypothetical protein
MQGLQHINRGPNPNADLISVQAESNLLAYDFNAWSVSRYNPRHLPVIPIEAKIWPTHCSVTVLDYRSDHIEDLALAALEDGLDWTTAKLVAEDYLGSVYHYPC